MNCDFSLVKENKIFWVDDENINYIVDLFNYFYGKKEFETNNRLLSKGLLTIGNVGSGKSLIMEQISRNLTGLNAYNYAECTQLSNQWLSKDHTLIRSVLARTDSKGILNHVYFDDLGDEEPVPNFGVMVEPMEKIITQRNRAWHIKGTKSHFSTNLSIDMIEQRYGERVKSRLLHMCNVLYLGEKEDSKDRRVNWK